MNRFLTALLALAFCGSFANGQTIVRDQFSGTNGSSLNGRTPDTVDLPGRTFTSNGIFGAFAITTGAGNPVPGVDTTPNSRFYIDISDNGPYVKPSLLTLSADINASVANDSFPRGVGLGFFTAAPSSSSEAHTNFSGLRVKNDGTLNLLINGVVQAASVAPFSGFTSGVLYNLSYTVDITTGSITSVIFNGNDDTATFSGAVTSGVFTNANTNLAGMYGSSASSGLSGTVDNFIIIAVPEPQIGLMLLGSAGIFALLKGVRRGKRA